MTWLLTSVSAVVLLLTACTPSATPPEATAGPSHRSETARTELAGLRLVTRPAPDSTYRRAAFGPAWSDVDHDGCSQRKNALAVAVDRNRPLVERHKGRCAHDVIAGTWTDPYTGKPLTFTDLTNTRQAQQIPIDHVVALATAYRYGASSWTADQRLAFANDLSNLQPTARSTNLSKSDRDPAAWKPAQAFQCDYAVRYITVKSKYALPVDTSEKEALTDMLDNC